MGTHLSHKENYYTQSRLSKLLYSLLNSVDQLFNKFSSYL